MRGVTSSACSVTMSPPSYRSHTIRFQYDQRSVARMILARILWLQGFPDQALRTAQGNVEDARAIDHALSLCYALEAACRSRSGAAIGGRRTLRGDAARPFGPARAGRLARPGPLLRESLLIKRGEVRDGSSFSAPRSTSW